MAQNNAAWITAAKARPFEVKEAPLEKPGDNEILVKNHAVAINPVDWKIQAENLFGLQYPNVLGSDLAGTVEEVGASVTSFKKGQRVMGLAGGLASGMAKKAAFQQYTIVSSSVACKIPDDMSFKDAVVLPLAISTAAHGLFSQDHLKLPYPTMNSKSSGQTLLVWGGSSSVGTAAIQLAKAAGLEVFTTASKRNHDMCQKIGADQVFDYSTGSVEDDIVKALQGKTLGGIYDAISDEDTIKMCIKIAQGATGSKQVATTIPGTEKLATADVSIHPVFGAAIVDTEISQAVWGDFAAAALEKKALVPMPASKVVGDGLENIQKACDELQKGVSGSKLVVTL